MGFLADFGRSGAYNIGQNLLGQVNQLGQQQIQAEQQKLQQTLEFAKIKPQLDAMAEDAKPYNMNLDPILDVYKDDPVKLEKFKKFYFQAADADELGNTTRGGAKRARQALTLHTQAFQEVTTLRLEQLKEEYSKVSESLARAKRLGLADNIKKLTTERDSLEEQYAMATGKLVEYRKAQQAQGDELSTWQKAKLLVDEARLEQGERRLDQQDKRLEQQGNLAERRFDESQRKQAELLTQQKVSNERNMRKDFEALPEVKNFTDVAIKAKQMEEAITESKKTKNFVAVDQALITMYNKMLDPTSVVRESEYARTSTDIALLNRIRGKAEKIMTGGAGLTADERNALYVMSQRFLNASKDRYVVRANEWRSLSTQYGLDPDRVIFRNIEESAPSGTPPSAPGTGKKYKVDAKGNITEVK